MCLLFGAPNDIVVVVSDGKGNVDHVSRARDPLSPLGPVNNKRVFEGAPGHMARSSVQIASMPCATK